MAEQFKELNEFRAKTLSEKGKGIIRKRKELTEHPFGTIKRGMGFGHFLQRGEQKIRGEFSFIGFVYNLKRVMKIVAFRS